MATYWCQILKLVFWKFEFGGRTLAILKASVDLCTLSSYLQGYFILLQIEDIVTMYNVVYHIVSQIVYYYWPVSMAEFRDIGKSKISDHDFSAL